MASETLGADELPRERHRWSENYKVYARKYKNNIKKNNDVVKNLDDSTTTTSAAAAPVESRENENTVTATNNIDNEAVNDNNVENDRVDHGNGNGVAAINNSSCSNSSQNVDNNGKEDDNEKNGEDGQENVSLPPELPAEGANSSQPQQNSPRLGTLSGDSSSLNRDEAAPVPNGHDGNLENGVVLRPLVTQVDDRLSISVSAARSKEEVKGLKRKLVDELDQVRKMAKKLEDKENQLSTYSSMGVETTPPVVGRLHFPVNGGVEKGVGGSIRMHSEAGSAGYRDSRSFRQLSVSVMDNNNHGVGGEIVEKEKRTPKANQYYRNSEFLLGKDRLPPAESNRKSKSSGGKKHGGGEMDFAYRIDKKIFSKCSSLLQKIMNHKHGWVFNQPVDVKRLGLRDYFDIIKHPMDLGTVKGRLTKNWYKTPREFAEDVRLTFHNALTYNPPGQDVHIMARELLNVFEDKWPAIESEYDRKLRYEMIRDLPTPTSRKTYAPAHVSVPMSFAPPPLLHPPPTIQEIRNLERSQSMPVRPESRPRPAYSAGRKPAPKKPKAKDPHKRDMTFEEKQKLSTHLQSLPSEKLDAIVQIIKKRNSALSQHDDEIEVDIDSVDAETLWELDRFVTNYKKSLSKHKRRAELAQARAAAAQAVQETIQVPATVEVPGETTADKGNVAASPPAQQERRSDNESGSSSSSSSSSDSGSSSDSDSDSSSGSDSDGGH
ncbi:transcription factor GTE4-like [Chenopodium quinoa]|uniref:Transcription factor GTE4 n=1 Tax=Chenopodium quinoa TaxID=63459 RepID=A0A803LVP0_CHEQI|nr:transcription factor GTE4-like [Chenopodium quinoa]XP_021773800.1 transcription factor GTE4-like [Chenopodium quinoa]XP_021773801.1 transcription factor GTE4-like [Chenopodium quinoa]